MEGILKVNPEQMISAAAELSTCRTTIGNITTSMTDIVHSISPAAYTGEDAQAYIAKFDGLQGDISKIHALVEKHISDLNEMATNFKNAQASNIATFESLPIDGIG